MVNKLNLNIGLMLTPKSKGFIKFPKKFRQKIKKNLKINKRYNFNKNHSHFHYIFYHFPSFGRFIKHSDCLAFLIILISIKNMLCQHPNIDELMIFSLDFHLLKQCKPPHLQQILMT